MQTWTMSFSGRRAVGLRATVISDEVDAYWPSDCHGMHSLLHARRVYLQQCGTTHKAWARKVIINYEQRALWRSAKFRSARASWREEGRLFPI